MKNYLREIFSDVILSIVTKKFGNSLNDAQREDKADEIIQELHSNNTFTVDMTQALIDKKGFNNFFTTNLNGTSVYGIVKEGMFHKVKICYFISRSKDTIDNEYLDKVYEELRKQALGENVFHSSDYKNG